MTNVERPAQPAMPIDRAAHDLLGRGDRTFEQSVSRRVHTSSPDLKELIKALTAFQFQQHNTAVRNDLLRELERAALRWESHHPKEVEKRGHLLSELKRDIATRLTQYGMRVTPANMHRRVEAAFRVIDAEHGQPVNLWQKAYGTMKGTSAVGSLGSTAVTNMSGGGAAGMLGGGALVTVGAATGVGLVVGGVVLTAGTSIAAGRSARSSHKHKKALEELLAGADDCYCNGIMGNELDSETHTKIQDHVLPYIINQKRKKRWHKGLAAIPVVSLVETVRAIGRKAYKKYKGTLGSAREAHACTLADHLISHDCELTQAIVRELFSDEEEEWLRFQEFAVVAGFIQAKLKST